MHNSEYPLEFGIREYKNSTVWYQRSVSYNDYFYYKSSMKSVPSLLGVGLAEEDLLPFGEVVARSGGPNGST